MQNTLWPETQKLYGHGYEVYALAANSTGSLLASACKAAKAQHAAIILWNTATWKQHHSIAAHQLTVTQMSFSPDDRQLLSVSRDRCWTMCERITDDDPLRPKYRVLEQTTKENCVHSRIIWACAWTPDGHYFATASRDSRCIAWHRVDAEHQPEAGGASTALKHYTACGVTVTKDQPLTAVAFSQHVRRLEDGQPGYVAALGTNCGRIRLMSYAHQQWHELRELPQDWAHHMTVRRLAFRPVKEYGEQDEVETAPDMLASCGDDHLVRMYEVRVKQI